jgi:hypothetical protein
MAVGSERRRERTVPARRKNSLWSLPDYGRASDDPMHMPCMELFGSHDPGKVARPSS